MGRNLGKKTIIGEGNIRMFSECPPGWLTLKEFGERAGVSGGTVNRAVREGLFNLNHLGKYRSGKFGTPAIIIDWNRAGYDYIARKQDAYWPKDFKPNPEKIYKPIPVNDNAETEDVEQHYSELAPVAVVDLPSAKLREAQLKIKKAENELAVVNNRLIEVEDVKAINMTIAVEIRMALQHTIRILSRELVGQTDQRKIENILQKQIGNALEKLSELEKEENEIT